MRTAANRLQHRPSGVEVDLLFAGEPRPRPGAPPHPSPLELGRSAREPDVVDLPGLLELKLTAARHQDLADVVARVKQLDEAGYLEAASRLHPGLRAQLLLLRRDALDELARDDRSR